MLAYIIIYIYVCVCMIYSVHNVCTYFTLVYSLHVSMTSIDSWDTSQVSISKHQKYCFKQNRS